MKRKLFKLVSIVLAMLLMVPATIFPAVASTDYTNAQLSVVSDKESTLAPGVTLNSITAYDKNGDQVKMFVTTADLNVDTVKLFASYKDMDPTNYGMSKLTEQVAAFDKKAAAGDEYYQGTVVAGINSSYYNMTTGKPTGTFVMNGIDVTNETEGNKYGYFAVMKDGTYKIGNKGDYSKDKGNIQEAVGIYHMLIVDGEICAGLDAVTKYPRQTIGLTADNKLILMTADGNQAPTSIGLTIQEQAQVMYDLGCVWAGHLDGGGSCTYASKPEGQDDFVITNSPSDGSERSVSNGFIIVSTEVASYEFASVLYSADYEYVAPGASIEVALKGASSTGHSAEIPVGVTYVTENGSFVDGVFTAGSEVGIASITAVYNGKAVGAVTFNVVNPDAIAFTSSEITVPFAQTVELTIDATYGVKKVALDASSLDFVFANSAIGTMNGYMFTACEENTANIESAVTAILKADATVKAITKVTLGKGSEVVYDFEDGTAQGVTFDETPGTQYNYVWPETAQKVVTAETGKVHSGKYALSGTVNYANSLESGYMKTSMYASEQKVFENAVGVGIWIYIPDEFVGLWARWTLRAVTVGADGSYTFGTSINSNTMDTSAGGTGVVYSFDEPGWHYLYADTSAYSAVGWAANSAMMQFYISDRDGAAYDYKALEQSNIPATYQLYFDDLTVDYSTAVDDREAPIFSDLTYAVDGMADAAILNGQVVTANKVSFGVAVADYTGKSNYTGIDASSVKAYIDGVEVAATYANGKVSLEDVVLSNGKHIVKFSACDKVGNYGSAFGEITINAPKSNSTVKLVAADPAADRIKLGSIYNMNLVATAVEEVEKVEVIINLDNNSVWQLDHMIVAEGFVASYTLGYDNTAIIIVEKNGNVLLTGEAVLVTMPVRVWSLKTGYTYENGTKAGVAAYTMAQFKTMKEFWKMSVIADVEKGVLVRTDASVDTFTGEGIFCDTEMWGNYATMTNSGTDMTYYNAWNGGHIHSAESMEDKSATCTENGYTGRTFCDGCNSVVEWGTTEKALGHTYAVVDGILQCACGGLFNGEYTDGKFYVNGVAVENGWNGDKYYMNGVAFTGIRQIDGYYYNFGEDGVCAGQAKYTGLFYDESVSAYRFSKLGVLTGGWNQIDGNWHYFKNSAKVAVTGEYVVSGVTYIFDECGKTDGAWHVTADGTRYYYGPSYYIARNPGYMMLVEIDGNTYNFDNKGYITTGIRALRDSTSFKKYIYSFDENGIMTNKITEPGTVSAYDEYSGDTGLFLVNEDGYVPMNAQLVKVGANYYYVLYSGKVRLNYTITLTNDTANGLVAPGDYTFGADGKMIVPEEEESDTFTGIREDYYYENGKIFVGGKGMVEFEGNLYYV
ncbi:MAG: phosphodiester glycosidase family protein, partial [Clostridia bacterium]|nr:phosphodiester glycosidase family protein [Clostridia bacterium]